MCLSWAAFSPLPCAESWQRDARPAGCIGCQSVCMPLRVLQHDRQGSHCLWACRARRAQEEAAAVVRLEAPALAPPARHAHPFRSLCNCSSGLPITGLAMHAHRTAQSDCQTAACTGVLSLPTGQQSLRTGATTSRRLPTMSLHLHAMKPRPQRTTRPCHHLQHLPLHHSLLLWCLPSQSLPGALIRLLLVSSAQRLVKTECGTALLIARTRCARQGCMGGLRK